MQKITFMPLNLALKILERIFFIHLSLNFFIRLPQDFRLYEVYTSDNHGFVYTYFLSFPWDFNSQKYSRASPQQLTRVKFNRKNAFRFP